MLGGISRGKGAQPLLIGGHIDHVHLLTSLPRTLTIAEFVKELKRSTTKWIKAEKGLTSFSWQNGYGTFSVSSSRIEVVKAYIRKQDEHHRKVTFQEEYLAFLQRHDVTYDERYIWD